MGSTSLVLPYLLLVTFFTPSYIELDADKIKTLNESPFHGAAVALRDAYSAEKLHEERLYVQSNFISRQCKKAIWPWIFFNRFIGYRAGDEAHEGVAGSRSAEKFKVIKGIDLYNDANALDDFFEAFKIALRVAQQTNSPGIVIDSEAYNNYNNYRIEHVAAQIGRPQDEVRTRLKEIGAQLSRTADQIYPGAVLWFLHTPMKHENNEKDLRRLLGRDDYTTVGYIILGALEAAKQNNSKLLFISGSSHEIGYCYYSLQDLEDKIRERAKSMAPYIEAYPNFRLGGTIALWANTNLKKGYWVQKAECKGSQIKNLEEFIPLVTKLIRTYGYLFIYAAGDISWNPYDRKITAPYNAALEQCLSDVDSEVKEKQKTN